MTHTDVILFFQDHPAAFPIYRALADRIAAEVQDVNIRVMKTMIAFSNRRQFACVSFLPVRRAKERPEVWLTVTFGLAYRKESPRIDAATEPYPNRWTHHVMLSSVDEIDDELMGWIREASEFSAAKR